MRSAAGVDLAHASAARQPGHAVRRAAAISPPEVERDRALSSTIPYLRAAFLPEK